MGLNQQLEAGSHDQEMENAEVKRGFDFLGGCHRSRATTYEEIIAQAYGPLKVRVAKMELAA
jgi:hypothetical protein